MNVMTFADWLKTRRLERGLTQSELEQRAGLSEKYVSAAERGRVKLPEPDTRERIHSALGTTDDDLVAVGLLSKLDFDGGPVYVNPRNIPPGDREAERAHRAFEGRPAPIRSDDPRVALMDLLAGATDEQVQVIVNIVTLMLGGIEANRAADAGQADQRKVSG
jgi:transcriptional regulator with XRE-family HTH domain